MCLYDLISYYKFGNGKIQSDLQVNEDKTTSLILMDSTASGSCGASDSHDFTIMAHNDQNNYCSIPESSNEGDNPDAVNNERYISQDGGTDGDCDQRRISNRSPKPSDNGNDTFNCNHKCISSTDDTISKDFTMRSMYGSKQDAVCSKLVVTFSIVLIIGIFSLPIILFFVNHIGDDNTDSEVDIEFSPENHTEVRI